MSHLVLALLLGQFTVNPRSQIPQPLVIVWDGGPTTGPAGATGPAGSAAASSTATVLVPLNQLASTFAGLAPQYLANGALGFRLPVDAGWPVCQFPVPDAGQPIGYAEPLYSPWVSETLPCICNDGGYATGYCPDGGPANTLSTVTSGAACFANPIALVNSQGFTVQRGSGNFNSAVTVDAGPTPVAVALADLNGDGWLDMIVLDSQTQVSQLWVVLGSQDGGFGSATGSVTPVIYSTGNDAGGAAMVVGDFARSGYPSVAVANTYSGATGMYSSISVFVNAALGDGGLLAGVGYDAGGNCQPDGIATADFDLNGTLDLAFICGGTNKAPGNLGVMLGYGDGGFQAPTFFTGVPNGAFLVTADFNGDGYPDLAFTDGGTIAQLGGIAVLLNHTDGGFGGTSYYVTSGANPFGLAVGDFNGDGNLDVVNTNEGTTTAQVALGNGSGNFSVDAGQLVNTSTTPWPVWVGDFNGDNLLDFIVANEGGTQVLPFLAVGQGRFSGAVGYTIGTGAKAMACGDLNNDGAPDCITVSNSAATASLLYQSLTPLQHFFVSSINASASPQDTGLTPVLSGAGAEISLWLAGLGLNPIDAPPSENVLLQVWCTP